MKMHTRETAQSIKPGDRIRPDQMWNATVNDTMKLAETVGVREVYPATSQTGIMVEVVSKSGMELRLDAGWFYEGESYE